MDVFFVLSGFLITGILYREVVRDGYVHFADFWARRVRRILPAATLVLMVCMLGVLTLAPPFDVWRAASDTGMAAVFMVNWLFARRATDYFAQGGSPSVVLHYWSLAVEEQFYLFWPLVVALAIAARSFSAKIKAVHILIAITLALWATSFWINVYLAGYIEPFAFFKTIPRIWELLTGALIAFFVFDKPPFKSRVMAAVGWTGLGAIVAATLCLSNATQYPGWAALLPVLGTAAVIVAGHGAAGSAWPGQLLTSGPLRFLGRISYSWYLWHWPLMWFGNLFLPHPVFVSKLALFAGSLAVGAASYYFVENPIRHHAILQRSARLSLAFGAVLISISLATASILWWLYANPPILLRDGTIIPIRNVLDDLPRTYFEGCNISQLAASYGPCVYGTPTGFDTVVLFGDSHAAQYFPPLEKAALELGWRLLVRTKSSCPPVEERVWISAFKREYVECDRWKINVLSEIQRVRPTLVIAAWDSDYELVDPTNGGPVKISNATQLAKAGERRLSEDLRRYAKSVVLVRDTPFFPEPPIRCLIDNPRREKKCHWKLTSVLPRFRAPISITNLDPRIDVVDITPEICQSGVCPAVQNDEIEFRDQHHLSASAALRLTPTFMELLQRANRPLAAEHIDSARPTVETKKVGLSGSGRGARASK